MNDAIFAQVKRVEELWPEVDELRKDLHQAGVGVDTTTFLSDLQTAYTTLADCLGAEKSRLDGLAEIASHVDL